MPALHQHLLHARNVQIVLLTSGPITPAPPFPPAPMTRRTYLPVQVKFDFSVVQYHRKLRAARMEIEPTRLAMVDKTCHVFLACVAVTWHVTRRSGHKLEGTFGVEWVEDGGRRRIWRRRSHGAVHVEIVVANAAAAFVSGTDPDFFATVALERYIRVFEFQLVLWVAEVTNLVILHDY